MIGYVPAIAFTWATSSSTLCVLLGPSSFGFHQSDRLMAATKGLATVNSDLGGCTGGSGLPSASCPPGALLRLDATQRGASWFFTWLGERGHVWREGQVNG